MEFTPDVKQVLSGRLGLHIAEWPSKKGWGFVGSVPADLLYQMADGSVPPDEIIADIRQACMPAMSMKVHGVKHRGFASKDEAVRYAEERGYQVCQLACCKK